MQRATLLYKCRLCGEVTKGASVPDGLDAVLVAEGQIKSPWAGGVPATTLHHCSAVMVGVADFAGFQNDTPGDPA